MGLPLALLVALCLTLTWAGGSELRRAGRTRNHGQSVCSTWGNSHYKTFDGDVFRFPGLCDYNFASDCRDTYQEFAVHLKRAPGRSGGHPQVEYILLTVKGDAIYLTSQLAVVNGAVVSSPHYSPGLLIEKNDAYTKVYSRAGLMLMWNREDSVMLELDSKFRNHTCGLCGDYNGLQTYSEFLSDGVLFSPVEFGNMQKVNKPEEVCEGPQEVPTPASCSEHRAECERLLTDTVFEDCRDLVPLELYVQACVQDRCQCPHGASCVCSTIAEFSRQCSHAGGRPRNWRTASLCPKSCPRTMVYLESGSPCMDTCSHLEVSSLCEEHRMDGCFCPEGTVYDDIKGDGCIPVNQCHCKLHGHLYAPGQQITNNCEQCVCNAGRWVCQDLQCPGTCALEGGAHITTFDERKYTFHGDCYYVLTKDTHDSYAVLGELTPCGSTDKQTCLKTVVLLADNKKNVVAFKLDGSVLLNELKVNLPHVTASFSILQPSSYHIVVTTAFGLRLQVQLVPVMQLFLTLDHAAQGLVQGLCGNFNGLEGDDFRTPGGLVEATGAGFANSWKAQSSCRNKLDWLDDPCSLSIESANYAEHWCSLLKKTESPFSKCHSAVDPAEYYKRCKYDTCNCQSTEDCMCAALSSYARACTIKGVTLWGWRERVCNKDVGSCPRSQVFLYNLTTCQPTCRSLSEPDTHCVKGFAPVDGCGCPDHTFLDEKGRCVVLAKCSCYHDGLYLEAGKTILRQEKRCVCQNGRLHCLQVKQPYQRCPAPKIHVDCNNRTALATRNPRPVSCQTLAAGYYQMECISGCVCPEGLIDDGRGGCVVEEACPCVHNKDLYSPGDKIRVDCNACTCQKGRWACTQSVCHGTCAIYGNSHYITFDGKYYDFDGRCSYVAVQDYCGQNSSLGSFSVITENVPCGTTGVTCSKAIKIFLGRTELKLEDKHCMVIQRDVGHHVAYTTREVGQYLVVEASVGILVIWDKRTSVFIKLAPSYKGTVCGLCGNFDQRSSNDFTTRDHMVVESELDFGNSWKEAPTCPDVSATPEPCVLRPHRRSWAEKQCSIIKGPVFGVCHSKVDPKPFYEACVHDSCSCDTGGDCECFCSAVAAYAQECTKEGACVFWRTPELCPIFCDYYNPPNECQWHYEPCGTHSFETCRTISGVHSNISVSHLEGCYPRCPKDSPIYDEDLKTCVTRDQCGCYANGTHYAPGEPVPTEQICHSCMCNNSSQVVCQPEVGKNVTSKEDSPFCYWVTCGPNGTVEEHFGICEPTPPPSSPSTPATTTSVSLITPSTTTSTTLTASTVPSPSSTTQSKSPLRLARLGLCCSWSDWINDDHPRIGSDGGDRETFNHVCRAPKDIECRVAIQPHLRWEELGQEAQCNVSFGFICKNEDQFGKGPFEVCYDYEIRVYCCLVTDECPGTPTPTPTTTTTEIPTPPTTETATTTPTTTSTGTPTATPITTTTEIPTPTTTETHNHNRDSKHYRDPDHNTHHHFNWDCNCNSHHNHNRDSNSNHYDSNSNHYGDRNHNTHHHNNRDSNSDPHHNYKRDSNSDHYRDPNHNTDHHFSWDSNSNTHHNHNRDSNSTHYRDRNHNTHHHFNWDSNCDPHHNHNRDSNSDHYRDLNHNTHHHFNWDSNCDPHHNHNRDSNSDHYRDPSHNIHHHFNWESNCDPHHNLNRDSNSDHYRDPTHNTHHHFNWDSNSDPQHNHNRDSNTYHHFNWDSNSDPHHNHNRDSNSDHYRDPNHNTDHHFNWDSNSDSHHNHNRDSNPDHYRDPDHSTHHYFNWDSNHDPQHNHNRDSNSDHYGDRNHNTHHHFNWDSNSDPHDNHNRDSNPDHYRDPDHSTHHYFNWDSKHDPQHNPNRDSNSDHYRDRNHNTHHHFNWDSNSDTQHNFNRNSNSTHYRDRNHNTHHHFNWDSNCDPHHNHNRDSNSDHYRDPSHNIHHHFNWDSNCDPHHNLNRDSNSDHYRDPTHNTHHHFNWDSNSDPQHNHNRDSKHYRDPNHNTHHHFNWDCNSNSHHNHNRDSNSNHYDSNSNHYGDRNHNTHHHNNRDSNSDPHHNYKRDSNSDHYRDPNHNTDHHFNWDSNSDSHHNHNRDSNPDHYRDPDHSTHHYFNWDSNHDAQHNHNRDSNSDHYGDRNHNTHHHFNWDSNSDPHDNHNRDSNPNQYGDPNHNTHHHFNWDSNSDTQHNINRDSNSTHYRDRNHNTHHHFNWDSNSDTQHNINRDSNSDHYRDPNHNTHHHFNWDSNCDPHHNHNRDSNSDHYRDPSHNIHHHFNWDSNCDPHHNLNRDSNSDHYRDPTHNTHHHFDGDSNSDPQHNHNRDSKHYRDPNHNTHHHFNWDCNSNSHHNHNRDSNSNHYCTSPWGFAGQLTVGPDTLLNPETEGWGNGCEASHARLANLGFHLLEDRSHPWNHDWAPFIHHRPPFHTHTHSRDCVNDFHGSFHTNRTLVDHATHATDHQHLDLQCDHPYVTAGTQRECCYLNNTYYAPGELVYNSTHGDTCYYVNCSLDCTLEIFKWSCPSTPTTQPSMTSSVPPTTKPPACLDFDPPRQENETWWLCNCTMATCKYNNTVELVEVKCDPPPMPTCSNGLMPVRVEDPDKCCWHWECDCYCTGWGDPHYVTFDGLYYSYKGNCTYVLVEEVTPTMDNFGVYIDNQHCDIDSQVSCPRTLIVRHETQEVLIKTVHTMPMRVQVQVNRQAVAMPYRKYGLQVYQSGINYVVDIPELGALISYDSLSFSIRLPYHRFGNNTKGQCGTCTNSTSDDCMLPGGEAVASCEVAAGHWVVNDPSEPQCPHRGFTTERPAAWPSVGSSTTTGTRSPSPLCELIKDSLFARCHAVASPRHYYEGCTSDSFAAPGSGLECASLQTYAALCAQKGICVDWRSRTGGACPVTCPAHREYRACGPVEEPTCRSSPTQANSPRLAEGCFCPKGTTSYAPGFDVCVDLCGCVGPDNVPREFGEHFEFDCKDCICLEGGSGIICRPKTCHPRPRVECKEKGTYTVTEVDPANVCCNITSCKCNTSLCRDNPPPCPLGFEVKSKMVPGRCCPFYSCVPKGVCVLRNAEYQPGSPVFSSKCQNCTCTDRRDNATQLNVVSCTHVPCNTSCNRGFELVDVPGECCKKCQQTQCIVINQPGSQSVVLKPGDMKRDPLNNCTFFSCMKIHDQFISSVSSITCPDFDPSTCLPGSITLMPNGCCRKCLPRNETRVPCSTVPVVREISHNGCTKLVTMNDCSGSCGTFAMYSAEAQSLDHRCSCCKEQRTSQREVTLQCPDGRGLNHTYTHIDSCLCQDTMCELPPWRRARRSGLRDLGPGQG
ncbi:mucin-2 [Orcinus orca]|uniref:mucin-2 n=1 Tax=Orcinus orca TaxID=9733 RepID=UPI0021118B56|nr:mucin-2 [Orcinus orca]